MNETRSTSPSFASLCTGCRQPLEPEALEGLCARCLLGGVLLAAGELDGADEPAHELAAANALEGRTLGGCVIQEKIAQGGMGVVFRAKQLRTGRMVALKVISAGALAAPRVVERFQNEARAAARLDHPNIVPIYEVGEDRGWHFFSMRFIEGGTVADLIRSGPLDPSHAARLLAKVARAAGHAHQRGILHRDLKPTNILLDGAGEPQLTDFGLARLAELETGLTRSRAVLGTPAYMAPEQAESQEITTATDVYGLGAVLYEMLAGHPPFEASSAPALLRRIAEEEPPPLPASVERDLGVVCLKCLEKNPARRYATAGELADELERWLRHEPIHARPASAAERAGKWMRRHPAASAAAGISILALAAVATLGALFTLRLSRSREEAQTHAAVAQERLTASRLTDAARRSAEGDGFSALLSLSAALQDTPDDAAGEIRSRMRAALQASPRLLRVWSVSSWAVDLRFDANDTVLSAVLKDGSARAWNLRDNAEIPPPPGPPPALSVISPDGSRIAQALPDAPFARVWHVAEGTAASLEGLAEPPSAFAFHPDGRTVAAARALISFMDARTGRKQEPAFTNDAAILWLGWRPDGNALLTVDEQERAKLWRLESREPEILPHLLLADLASPQFSPDGRWLLAAHRQRLLKLDTTSWNADFRQETPLALDAQFSPDGSQFATAGFHSQALLWDTEAGRSLGYRFEHESGANKARFSPDGRWLATAGFDDVVRLRWLDTRNFGARALHQGGLVWSMAFSASGRFLAAGNGLGLIQIWDLAPSQPRYLASGTMAPLPLSSGRYLPLASGTTVRFWDIPARKQDGTLIILPETPAHFVFGSRVLGAAFGAGGAGFWEIASRQPVRSVTNSGPVAWLSLSPDETAAALVAPNGTARLLDLKTGQWRGAPIDTGSRSRAPVLAWSRDGRWLAGGGNWAQVWDTRTGQPAGKRVEALWGVNSLAFSPDGSRLLISFEDRNIEPSRAQSYSVPSLEPAGSALRHSDGVGPAIFSPDGSLIATAGQDNVARLWHSSSRALAGPVLRHGGDVIAAAFSANGKLLATGARDGLARIWDVARGELIAPPVRVGRHVQHVAFTSDGLFLAAMDENSRAHVLQIYADEALAAETEFLAECASGMEATPHGAGNPLPAEEVATQFARLFHEQPQMFAWPLSSAGWHAENAAQAEDRRDWPAAVFHLRQLARSRPSDVEVLRRLERAEAAR